MSIPVPYIDAAGIHSPAYSDILNYYISGYQGIYGADVVLSDDTQDGQWLAIQAQAYFDVCQAAVAVFNSFSPSNAQGTGLSSLVKLNGIARDISTYSTAPLLIVGQAGAIITNGVASDENENNWILPASVTIPLSGQIEVTATAQNQGAITAPAGTITTIETPTQGWQTVTNTSDATPGNPVELDPALRIRQSESTSIPAISVAGALKGALLAITGVVSCEIYENDTDTIDSNGIPSGAISIVIDGGDLQTIVNTIGLMKGQGVGTYGNTIGTYIDTAGTAKQISFFVPNKPQITYLVSLKALTGFTTDIQAQIASVLSNWTNGLGVFQNVLRTKAFVPANLQGQTAIEYFLANGAASYSAAVMQAMAASATFELIDIAIARDGQEPMPADVTIAFNEEAICDSSFVQFSVST